MRIHPSVAQRRTGGGVFEATRSARIKRKSSSKEETIHSKHSLEVQKVRRGRTQEQDSLVFGGEAHRKRLDVQLETKMLVQTSPSMDVNRHLVDEYVYQ